MKHNKENKEKKKTDKGNDKNGMKYDGSKKMAGKFEKNHTKIKSLQKEKKINEV